ncbi:MAG: hypothetical protein K2X08_05285, partial [Chlamydiales bacterium]|nr:hypothetical protein [Chlamydiales bacterium]
MKAQSLIKMFALGFIAFATAYSNAEELTTCWEVEELVQEAINDIQNTALSITALSLEEKTIENTIEPCQELEKRNRCRIKTLRATSKINGSAPAELATNRLQDLCSYIYLLSTDRELSKALELLSLKIAFQKALLSPLIMHRNDHNQGGGKIEATIGATWGGSEGIQYEAEIKGSVSDGKGNYVEAKAEHNFNTGEGRGSVS